MKTSTDRTTSTFLDAKKVMARLMDKPLKFFPEEPPASLEEVLNEDWFFDLT